ncbi:phosphomannomutase, partial [Salmonella enterica]|nr:phosphomannomutase [Salmonella enterica]
KLFFYYKNSAISVDYTDGLSMEFSDWRFNVRCSNTEPVVRLNVESKSNVLLMQEKTREILSFIGKCV